jgi:hypothetical protein
MSFCTDSTRTARTPHSPCGVHKDPWGSVNYWDDQIPNSFRAVCNRITIETGDVAGQEAVHDVCVFFQKRFAAITAENYSLSPVWPGKSIIEQLTHHAAGLFIWADTVMKFVEKGIPHKRLHSILQDRCRYREERLENQNL